jgi:hypothetical protein
MATLPAGRLRFFFALVLSSLASSSCRLVPLVSPPRGSSTSPRTPPKRLVSPPDLRPATRGRSPAPFGRRSEASGGDATGSGAPPPARLLGRRRRSSRGQGALSLLTSTF